MPFTVLSRTLAQPAPAEDPGAPLEDEGLTLDAMVEELDALLGRRADVERERFERWVNMAYLDLATSLQIDELKAGLGLELVPEQPLYLLPKGVGVVQGAALVLPSREHLKGGYPLDKISLSSYRSLQESTGWPKKFFRQLDMLVLWPTPAEARVLSLDVRIRPMPLVEPEHSPLLPPEWHEGILLGARARGFASLMEYDKAAAAHNEALAFVRRRTDREAAETEGRLVKSSAPQRREQVSNYVRGNPFLTRDD